MALTPVEPSCVTSAWTSKDILKTEGSCEILCRAIRKVTFQTGKVGVEAILSGSRFQERKAVGWGGMKCWRDKTEVVEDGSSAMTRSNFQKKWNRASLLTDTCLSSRKPLELLLEVVNILMLNILAHEISIVFFSHLVIIKYHGHLKCICGPGRIFLFELKVFE